MVDDQSVQDLVDTMQMAAVLDCSYHSVCSSMTQGRAAARCREQQRAAAVKVWPFKR